MTDYKKWLDNYTVSVKFSTVSGFEILEMLQARSHLALIESSLKTAERAKLESADETFLKHANGFYTSLSKIVDLRELRSQRDILPSHWWWYLDKLVQPDKKALAI